MNLQKFVNQLFQGVSQVPGTSNEADNLVVTVADNTHTAPPDQTPQQERPHKFPRLNSQEMHRMLSQLEFEGDISSPSPSYQHNPSEVEDLGKKYHEQLTKTKSALKLRGFWDESHGKSPDLAPTRFATQDINELEMELQNCEQTNRYVCKKSPDTKGFPLDDPMDGERVQNTTETEPMFVFHNAGNKKKLTLTSEQLEIAKRTFQSQSPNRMNTSASRGTHDLNFRPVKGNEQEFKFKRLISEDVQFLEQLDQESSRSELEQDTIFSTAGLFFCKPTKHGIKPLIPDQQAIERAQKLLRESPEKQSPPKSEEGGEATVQFGKALFLSNTGGFMKASFEGGGSLQLTGEAMERARK